MSKCEFHREAGCDGKAKHRVVWDMMDEYVRVYHVCDACTEAYEAAILAVLGPVDPRDTPPEHRDRTLQRFIDRVEFPDDLLDECWVMDPDIETDEYRYITENSVCKHGHQYAFEWAYQVKAPRWNDDEELLHECNRKSCCNPAHLWRGSHGDNMEHARHSGAMERELCRETAREIRELYWVEGWTQPELVEEFGSSQPNISLLVRGETYPDVGGPTSQAEADALVDGDARVTA